MTLSRTLLLTAALFTLSGVTHLHAQDKDDPFGAKGEDSSVEAPEPPADSGPKFYTIYVSKPIEATEKARFEPAPDSRRRSSSWETKTFRDSQGRSRIETHLPNGFEFITVNDVVAHKRYRWRDGSRQIATTDLPPNREHKDSTKPLPPDAPVINNFPSVLRHSANPSNPADSMDTWYSDDLDFVVKRIITRPKFGITTYELTKVKREEPNPKLFVPPGMK